MLKFKSFPSGTYTDDDISNFSNTHIIVRDTYLENGSIYFYYKETNDLGIDAIDKIERLNKAISGAQTELFDAERGLEEMERELADAEEEIAQTHPNEKEKWDELQEKRKFATGQIVMHKETIEGRRKNITDLQLTASQIELDERKES